MSRPLPRYRHDHDHEERGLGQRARRDGKRVPQQTWWDGRAGASELDRIRLRGIPAIARDVAGRVYDTDPFLAVQHWPEMPVRLPSPAGALPRAVQYWPER